MEAVMHWYKNEPFSAFWEKGYRDMNVSCMGGPSFEVAEILPALPENAKVLDLGCGEGRNAFFLAQQGCHVTAVDRSTAGINKLSAIAKECDISIKGIVQDIREFPLTEEYDLIMAHGVLYYLENAEWRKLLYNVKNRTRQGGFNIFTLFVYNEQYPCVEEIQAARYQNSFRPKELQEFYSDWIEHRFDRYVKWDSHPGIPLHYHPIEKLVSQKPLKIIEKKCIDIGKDMPEKDFNEIHMGMTREQLLSKVGFPNAIDRVPIEGVHLSMNSADHDAYRLELWYYGKYVIYLVNQAVTGRALYTTKPHRFHIVKGRTPAKYT